MHKSISKWKEEEKIRRKRIWIVTRRYGDLRVVLRLVRFTTWRNEDPRYSETQRECTHRLTTTSLNIYRRKDGHGRWLVVARDTKGARIQSSRRMSCDGWNGEGEKRRERERVKRGRKGGSFSNNPQAEISSAWNSLVGSPLFAEAFVRIDKTLYTP